MMFRKRESRADKANRLTSDALGGFHDLYESLAEAVDLYDTEERDAVQAQQEIQADADRAIAEQIAHGKDCLDRRVRNQRALSHLGALLGIEDDE